MATTSPDNILTPDAGDQYALVQDLGLLADSVQDALNRRGNASVGTVAQRNAFLATATAGMLWQDTDSIGMIWKKVGSAWVPAVWRWAGTTAQMNAFTQAPNGFAWGNTTTNTNYVRVGGAWVGDIITGTITPAASTSLAAGWSLTKNSQSGLVTIAASFNRTVWPGSGGQGLGTVPVGFRPATTTAFIAATNGATAPIGRYAEVETGGTLGGYSVPPNGQSWNYHFYTTYKAA